ncbi:hypothetical protein [Alistipes sp.]|uniref:hypothetical protein n=1 Tax=Alistipes sp. TaxID=1872444 RepID=UPI0025BDA9F4|nr:hypothetical protein [Alistipes sp.]MCI7140963.1 hypothetical protein [Alistipes sp.]MDY5395949.1 hypothetical protein [Alistipes sp.]
MPHEKNALLFALLFAACNTSEEVSTVEIEEPVSGICEYTPAPGQFINSSDAGFPDTPIRTAEEAADYAEQRLGQNLYVSLGGWGGYLVAEFAEPVPNTGGYDLYVIGNHFNGSSEPGIVWVAQKEDGAPGTWYQLRGSEYDNAETLLDYEVTYTSPTEAGGAVAWSDNRGCTGTIDCIGVHPQPSYVPAWVTSLTYRGTRLRDNVYYDEDSGKYIMQPFSWGYADNYSTIDRLGMKNRFRIADAVDERGEAAHLEQIDYIKVQTGVNAKAGNNVGEISTEVCGIGCYRTVTRTE